MPVQIDRDADGCFARWGDAGTKYRFECNDDRAKARAIDQAKAQGRAIAAQRNNIALKFPTALTIRGDYVEFVENDDWRMAFAWGHVRHRQGDFTVDDDFARHMIESFRYMRDTYGYYPPIAAEHEIEIDFEDGDGPQVLSGVTFGVIAQIETRSDGVWVHPMWNALGEKVNSLGAFVYVSPSFYPEWEDPHSGEVLKNMLREFTVCGNPHQKNLETPVGDVYGLSDYGFLPTTTPPTENPMEEEENENQTNLADEEMDELADDEETENADGEAPAWAQQMMAMLSKLMPSENEEGAGATENSEDDAAAQLAKANKRIANLERRVALADALVSVQAELPDVDEQEARDLAEMKLSDEKTYKRWVKRLKAAKPVDTSEKGRVGGSTGGGASGGPTKRELKEVVREAKKDGVNRGLPLVSFCNARGYDELGDEFATIVDEVYAAR